MRKTSILSFNDLKSSADIDVSIYIIIKFDEKSLIIVQNFSANEISRNFSANEILKFFANQISKFFAEEMFNIVVIKSNLVNAVNISMNLLIIKFSINFDFKIDTDYDFRN